MITIDACVFIEIVLEQPRWEECSTYLDSYRSKKKAPFWPLCVTPMIVYEVINRFKEEVETRDPDTRFTLVENWKMHKRNEIERFLTEFGKLMNRVKIIFPQGQNFTKLFGECSSKLPVGDQDKLNLAISMSNFSDNFMTLDEDIKNTEPTLKNIAKRSINIIYLKKKLSQH